MNPQRVALMTVAGALLAWLLLALLVLVAGPLLVDLDRALLLAVAQRRTPVVDRVAVDVTALGNTTTLAVLALCLIALLLALRHRILAGGLLLVLVGGRVLNEGLKAFFDRARPDFVEGLVPVVSQSFPSGHAMTATSVYLAVAWLVHRLGAGPALRRTAWLVATALSVAVAFSRVQLGVHYPADALGGILAGAVWTACVLAGISARPDRPDRPDRGT